MSNLKFCFVSNTSASLRWFLLPYIKRLTKFGEVHLISSFSESDFSFFNFDGIVIHNIKIERKASILKDMFLFIRLLNVIKKQKFDVIHSITPKIGFLVSVSAFLSRVECRFHTYTGQVWASKKGISRRVLKLFDMVIGMLNTFCLVDSPSQRNFLLSEKVISDKYSGVLGSGSVCGVDKDKFYFDENIRENTLLEMNLSPNDFVFLYLGRRCKEKGIDEFCKAIAKFNNSGRKAKFIFVGSDEDNYSEDYFHSNGVYNVTCVPETTDPNKYLNIANVLVLPSWREGFGSVLIEAAAVGVPAIASDIYGIRDAVVDKSTGLLFPVRSVSGLQKSLNYLYDDRSLLESMGISALNRINSEFNQDILIEEFLGFYKKHVII